MRVLFVTPFFEPAWIYGGIARTSSKWAHAVASASRWSVSVFTTAANGNSELPVEVNVPIRLDNIDVTYFPRLKFLKKRYISLSMAWALITTINLYDLVHIINLWTFGNVVACTICALRKVPYVVSLHGLLMPWAYKHHKWRKKVYMSLVVEKLLKRAAGVICATDMEKEHYLSLHIADSVKVISNISDGPEIEVNSLRKEFREEYGLGDTIMMLFVGRIVRNKGLHLTISAFSRVAQHYPTAKLFVMGPAEDNSFAKAEGQIKDLNLGDRFFYLGLQTGDNYWSAMAGADLFVLNSYSENFGNVVTDALSVGVPVLISDQVGIASLVSQYEAGEVATLEIHDIVEKMMRMLGEPERLREMGRRGIQLVRENCAHAVVGRQLADYFYEIYESIRFKV